MIFGRPRLETKSDDELRAMRRAGLVVAQTLDLLAQSARPGLTTLDLDVLAREFITGHGARPSFPDVPGYRHTLCVSVDEQVVHGIPGERVLRAGDVVSIDCGASVDGWHGDAAITLVVDGQARTPQEAALVADTLASLWAGVSAFAVGGHVGDLGAAVEGHLEATGRGYGVVDEYEGHGIGREMHMDPPVPNVRSSRRGPKVRSGATVAIEPMVTLGTPDTLVLDDDWTVVSADGTTAAHWEHTVAVTDAGLWVLTALDGGKAQLSAVGAPFAPLD
ncbi:type I methionyl aminopeptidase [Agilicoccus flavus]|uniref:type I methionyl aminopeptidase n=1 Tax=Agilicoccus flavus TaxID=2775968 RepID=UPI0027DA6202|nr:type I methionyl aminopeptidase [Agilicoccus flavus]